MGLIFRDRTRGISWRDQTLESISAPPLPLMVFFTLFVILMYFASCSEYRKRVERRRSGFKFGLLLLPLLVVLAVNLMMLRRRIWRYQIGVPRPVYDAVEAEEGGSAAVLVAVLAVLLAMIYFKSTYQSSASWFRVF